MANEFHSWDRRYDCAVVGAGIVGAACAFWLARQQLRVLVVEPCEVGGGATAAGMGHIVVMDDSDAQFTLTKHSRVLLNGLEPKLPISVGLRRRGTLWIAADQDELDAAESKREFYRDRGVAAALMNAKQLAAAEPNLRPHLAGALLVEGDSVVYPPTLAHWLLDSAIKLGAVLIRSTSATSIIGNRLSLSNGHTIEATVIVNAAGASAADLTPGLPIRRRKGHLLITDRYPGFCNHQLVELGYLKNAHTHDPESVAFNLQPRETGQILVGSSRQYDNESTGVDHRILSRMLNRAIEFMPGLATLNATRVWTGFRAATPDSLPIIGQHPGNPALFLACGHEGLGITTSLATADIITDLVLSRPTNIPSDPYSPSRFLTVRDPELTTYE